MNEIYEKNLAALQRNRPELYKQLQEIDTNEKFEVYLPEGTKYANIADTQHNLLFYEDADTVIEAQKKEFERYREYPFLYLFGIANGGIVEYLLQNKKLRQLVVIEPEIELVYIALNLIDFSQYLATNRLVILMQKEMTKLTTIALIHNSNAKYYIKVFKLLSTSNYYETYFEKEYVETYQQFIDTLRYVAEANGNDINDTFRGVKQHFANLHRMLERYKFQDLLKCKNSELAVIVATGPSLTKQLPLLKEYQDKVTIISVDASLPILIKNGIKPDVVTTMERDEPTANFFRAVEPEDQKEIVFLCASLQHKAVFDAIKQDSMVIAMRPFAYNSYFELDDYGYICKGMSSANMAHELAFMMGFKQCVFIGQDLAFGDDLKTHADDHVITEMDPEIQAQIDSGQIFEIEAYGGKGTVKTNRYWNIFKDFIEQLVEESSSIMTHYNATEGGARIKGTIEKPFVEVLEEFASKKEKIELEDVSKEEQIRLKKQTKTKLQEIVDNSLALQEDVNKAFLHLAKSVERLENKTLEESLEEFGIGETMELLSLISEIRGKIEQNEFYIEFLSSVIQPLMYHMELELAEVKVRYVDNPHDNQKKALQWIVAHRYWLFSFSGVLDNVVHIATEALEDFAQSS